ncbi:MAG: LamG-like jellyroll fold domain-containing protein [Anaerolineales bacterium]
MVNSEADTPDANTGDGNCATADNTCTLRAALMEANAGTGAKITFENVSTISPATALPAITEGNVTISGGGLVTLDGGQNLNCSGFSGLEINASSYNTIQGLTIINFGTGIEIDAFSGEAKSNIIGYDPNNPDPVPAQRNVIGGNCRGIYITGQNAFGNTVAGNYVGTDASGSVASPNQSGIILTNGAHDNLIGANETGAAVALNATDLISYWNMDEAGGNALDSHGSNDGAETSGTIATTAGKLNNARDLELGETEYFGLADNLDLSTGDIDYSFSAWVQLESKPGSVMTILSKRDATSGGNQEYTIGWLNTNDRLFFGVWNASGTLSIVYADNLGAPSVGTWYHIVCWHDAGASTVNIVVNNGPVNSSSAGTPIDSTSGFKMGAQNYAPAYFWDGPIDEVSFWKRVLAPQEIAALYNSGNGLGYTVGNPASNVISGNQSTGIHLAGADNNRISGNFIGTTVGGFSPLGNGDGLYLSVGADGNIIGMDNAGQGSPNIISGNNADGISLSASNNTTIAGNFIGTDPSGTLDLGNGGAGIFLVGGSTNNVIGTNGDGVADDLERNIISGSGKAYLRPGIWIHSANNIVAGNYIGSNMEGTAAIPNNGSGVSISGNNNRIGTNGDGTSDALEANIISGNATDGIFIASAFNQVSGNFIGTNSTGMTALGNGFTGVRITAVGHDNLIGTDGDGAGDLAERNIISANAVFLNGSAGIGIQGDDNVVAGNYIGLDAAGTASLGNIQYGITITGGANGNRVGTNGNGVADAAEGNVISGNGWMGIFVNDADNNWIAGNLIGTNAAGLAGVPNGFGANEQLPGIELRGGSSGNLIGTNGDGVADAAERNVISGNARAGMRIDGQGTANNVVAGNYIGTAATGSAALANSGVGVILSGAASSNRIGTDGNGQADAAEANVISGNTSIGVHVIVATSNQIAGNYIGTDKTGTAPLGNGLEGVSISSSNVGGTNGNTVGGSPEKANVIAFNQREGVEVGGVSSYPTGTAILYNSIFSNGDLGINISPNDGFYGVTPNDIGDVDSGSNNLMNFPELDTALSLNNSITISGDIVDGLPNTNFQIQFFSNPECDISLHGEGQSFIGETTEMTNGSGDVSFLVNLMVTVDAGDFITATATSANNTSEFSECVEVLAGSQMNLELDEPFSITPLRNLNCRYYCTQASDVADTLLQGIQYFPLGWDPISGFFAFEGPTFGERCFAPLLTGDTELMLLSYQGEGVTVDQLTNDLVEPLACPAFPTPTPTVDPDEGDNRTPAVPQCSDGIDNDGDGRIDYSATGAGDRECRDASDNDEAVP